MEELAKLYTLMLESTHQWLTTGMYVGKAPSQTRYILFYATPPPEYQIA